MSLTAALFAAFALSASAQELPIRFQPEPDFDAILRHAVAPLKARDAFEGLDACGIVDAKTLKPFALGELERALKPCADALSARYGTEVAAERVASAQGGEFSIQIEGIVFLVPAGVAKTDAVLRDLEHGIARRGRKILGHPAFARPRAPESKKDKDGAELSVAQGAIDRCILPMMLRKLESGADFIKVYGTCLKRDSTLKVQDLRPSPAHALGVMLLSQAAEPTLSKISGHVVVDTEHGPVQVMIVAYPETLALP